MAPSARYMLVVALSTTPFLPFMGGCKKQKYDVETTAPANAGQAQIELSRDKTGNGNIHLEFEHLPPPSRVDATLAYYVVWASADGKDPYKLGVLDYDAKRRSGSLDATFGGDRIKIIVTLERSSSVSAPMGARVLEQVVVAPSK